MQSVVLNLGCGHAPLALSDLFPASSWQEIRVDVDPAASPDVIADLRELPFDDASADAIVCLGVLEHFAEDDVGVVLREMARVLRVNGELKLLVPDLLALGRVLADGRLTEVLLESPAGPIRALDMLYGHQGNVVDSPFWAHRTGFTAETLANALSTAGFEGSVATSEAAPYMLLADAQKKGQAQ